MHKVERALISVSDKTGIVALARTVRPGDRALSTGGTAWMIAQYRLPVTEVSEYTGFPEMLDGRVKTLSNCRRHGGLPARRDLPRHERARGARHGFSSPDRPAGRQSLSASARPSRSPIAGFEDAIENIDIEAWTMLRAAAKNHGGVATLVDPADYEPVLEQPRANGGVDDRIARGWRARSLHNGGL
ncbi:MAG: hypothetical protein R3E48_13475 [Burkholderiaceae bacterium]